MNLSKIKKIYLIGIKGVGMTMLAQFLRGQNIEIIGSDTAEKYMTDEVLAKSGIKVIEEFNEENIPADADLIVYSTAYNAENNIEVKKALSGKIKTLKYAEALGEIFNSHYGIAVCGSHGKTTTTAWLGYILERAGLRPSVLVGSSVPQFSGAVLSGASDYFVAELDEYQNKLQYFQPKIVLLNNIDWDHPDFFPTFESYQQAFIDFIKKIPKKGFLIANFDDEVIRRTANVNCHGKVVSYGITNEDVDYFGYDIKSVDGKVYFKVDLSPRPFSLPAGRQASQERGDRENLGEFCISLSGRHNVSNALAVIATAIELGVSLVDIRTYLEEFIGTARRMQFLGEFKGAKIYDDYAHHPTEIQATLQGARELFGKKKITVVFHPHTFTRTKAYLDDFAKSFNDADEVIVLDIYGSAREKHGGVSSEELAKAIFNFQFSIFNKKEIKHIPTLDQAEKYLRGNLERGEVVILMGAGDVFRIGEKLLA